MNTYYLEYWNHTGCYRKETVQWQCSGDKYILQQHGPAHGDYYIVAKRSKL